MENDKMVETSEEMLNNFFNEELSSFPINITGKKVYLYKYSDIENDIIDIESEVEFSSVHLRINKERIIFQFPIDIGEEIDEPFKLKSKIGDWNVEVGYCNFFICNNNTGIGIALKVFKGKKKDNDIFTRLNYIEEVNVIMGDFQNAKLKNLEVHTYPIKNSTITGYFSIKDNYENLKNKWDEKFDNIFFLLRLYSGNKFNMRINKIFSTGNNYKEINFSIINQNHDENFKPIFLNYGTNFIPFIDSSYDKFDELKKKRIHQLIYYYNKVEYSNFNEDVYIFGSIFLETMTKTFEVKKNNFYENMKNILKNDLNLDKNKISCYLTNDKSEDFLCKIIKIRNAIIHEGTLKKNQHIEGIDDYNQLIQFQAFIRVLILKILNISAIFRDKHYSEADINSEIFLKELEIDEKFEIKVEKIDDKLYFNIPKKFKDKFGIDNGDSFTVNDYMCEKSIIYNKKK